MHTKNLLSRLNAYRNRLYYKNPLSLVGCDSRLSPRKYCSKIPVESHQEPLTEENRNVNNLSMNVGGYKPFRDQDAPIIFDVEEERFLKQERIAQEEEIDEFYCLYEKRGERGVFSAEELVHILRHQKAENIVVVSVPDALRYVDEMVIVTGKTNKHIHAIAEFVHRAFKRKRLESDLIPKLEGGKGSEWIAVDLGNIALHIFSHKARKIYDLETLWAVGPEFDSLLNSPDDASSQALKIHSLHLEDLQPASIEMK